jgi:hypothetical protein
MKLIQIYEAILRTAGYVVDSEGFVSVNNELFTGDPNQPAMIEGKRLVLPTEDHLRTPSDSKIIFHPLKEQAIHGESKVFTTLRESMSSRLSFTYAIIVNALVTLGKDTAKHKHLSPDQAEFLTAVRDITNDTDIVFTELFTRASKEIGGNSFVNIFMKKNGVVDDINYVRVGVVMFPFYEELLKEQDKYFGYTIKSKKDRQTIIRLLEYVLPGLSKTGGYNVGNNSKVAPYMGALLGCSQNLIEMFNHHLELYNTLIDPAYKNMLIDASWVGAIENEAALVNEVRMVPMQAGNEGTPHLASTQPNQPTRAAIGQAMAPQQNTQLVAPAAQYIPPAVPVMAPAQPVYQAPASSGGTMSVSDLINANHATQMAAAASTTQMMANGAYANVAMPGMPGMPGMMTPQMMQQLQLQQMMQAQAANGTRSNWMAGAVPTQAQGVVVNVNGVPMMQLPNGQVVPLQGTQGYPMQQQIMPGYQVGYGV